MKHALLVPVDFSKSAWNAATYAAFLAKKYGWNVQLLHVYQTYSRTLSTQDFKNEVGKYNIQAAESDMELFTKRFKKDFPEIEIISACMEGSLIDIILTLVEKNTIKFVVMGTKGASDLLHVILGSNTFELIQHCPIGVIAVPISYQTHKLDAVGALTNFRESEFECIESFVSRTSPTLNLSLLHLTESDNHPSSDDISFWLDKIEKTIPIKNVQYQSSEVQHPIGNKNEAVETIEKLIQTQNLDLLIVPYVRKSFFKSLFSRSLAKTIADKLTIPTYFKKLE